jgi:hypothetical protein
MSDAVKRVSAEISESEISRSRDFQADSALASGRASGNQLGRPRFARKGARPSDSRPAGRRSPLCSWRRARPLAIGWSRAAFAIARVSRHMAHAWLRLSARTSGHAVSAVALAAPRRQERQRRRPSACPSTITCARARLAQDQTLSEAGDREPSQLLVRERAVAAGDQRVADEHPRGRANRNDDAIAHLRVHPQLNGLRNAPQPNIQQALA